MAGKYRADFLKPRSANHVPLSPVSFVKRSAVLYRTEPAIDYGPLVRTWGEVYVRCRKLAAALRAAGVTPDSTVAALLPNIPAAVELAYAVPMSRGVLNMINTRLDAAGIAFIINHGEAEILFIDSGLAEIAVQALALADGSPKLIYVDDPAAPGPKIDGAIDYEAFFADADPLAEDDLMPADEWDAVALNYTSGTTGNPKGVVYHHRGAYLNGLGQGIEWTLPHRVRYLWILPLFHCNGWCFPWTLAAHGGVNICLRNPTADAILDSIDRAGVTHMCGAPIILNMVTTALEAAAETLPLPIKVMTAGAAPPAAVLRRAKAVGFDITHVYGLTEVYGPSAVCARKPEWADLSAEDHAAMMARQGVNYVVLEEMSVRDPDSLAAMPGDGDSMGEVMFRGNVVMQGYLKNPEATEQAFAGGYFRSGDLGVTHPDGYVELRDRSKDIIITGGENVSSIEVEAVLYQHPAVGEAAVVAAPDEKWGETPAAYVELRTDATVSEAELIAFTRDRLAHFKCPRIVVFGPLPKTATGKIQKFVIRSWAKELASKD